jgi:hypothetical protein
MTERPASWRMPTPKQMEKLAAAVGREPRGTPVRATDAHRILGRAPTGPAPCHRTRAAAPLRPSAAALRNSPAYSEGVLLPLCPDRPDPEGRCRPTLGQTAVWKNVGQRLLGEPTRIVQPASSSFGKRRHAALTAFCAATSRVNRSGEADGENVLTTSLPNLSILSNPTTDDTPLFF